MKNIYNKSIVYALGVLAVFAYTVLLVPVSVSAQEYGYNYSYGTFGNTSNNTDRYINNTGGGVNDNFNNYNVPFNNYQDPNSYNYSSNPSPNTRNNNSNFAPNNNQYDPGLNENSANPRTSGNNLAAGAIFGSNGFMPSSIVQWILFAILVLTIVILTRKVFGADRNYHATPLKHD